MDSKIWGPYFWFTLHTITLAYPDKPNYQEKRQFNDFFLSLQHVLPCKVCREHYKNHLKEFPISSHLDNKESLVKWCHQLHNRVNLSLDKPIFSYEEFKDKYRKIYSPTIIEKVINTENIKKYKKYKFVGLLIFLSAICGGFYYLYGKKKARKYFFCN